MHCMCKNKHAKRFKVLKYPITCNAEREREDVAYKRNHFWNRLRLYCTYADGIMQRKSQQIHSILPASILINDDNLRIGDFGLLVCDQGWWYAVDFSTLCIICSGKK